MSPPTTNWLTASLKGLTRLLLAAIVLFLLVARASFFSVSEGEAAVVTRFGRPVREIVEAGPYWSLPWPIEQVRLVDVRSRLSNTPLTATITRDRKNIILLMYFVWHVERPLLFLQSAGDVTGAERKLEGMVTAAKNEQMGAFDLNALVSTDRSEIRRGEIEKRVLNEVSGPALDRFGIRLEQVGVKRIAFPEENVRAVFAQMRAERTAEADRLRAEGERDAQAIRNEALVKAEQILRQGREEAGTLRGKSEKEAAELYARLHAMDPEFFRFWRSLRALRETLGRKATIILRSDQGFFDALHPPGAGSPPATPARKPAPTKSPRKALEELAAP